MSRLQVATELVRLTSLTIRLKQQSMISELRRATCKQVHIKQFEETEDDLTDALSPLFEKQIKDAGQSLASAGPSNSAAKLAKQVFDPRDYDRELIDLALPVLARAAGEAARAQLLVLGVKPWKSQKVALAAVSAPLIAKSTASEWLEQAGEELPPGLATELPDEIKREISKQLRDTFSQPYWKGINDSTLLDLESYLNIGLRDGMSIRDMARGISQAFPDVYSKNRATLVARTESGHALNGARKATVDVLKQEVPEVPMVQVWLSVLGFTTRDAHANLDGVPENQDGLWDLNGVMTPWPSASVLPAEDRCNCQCSIVTEFGMPDEQAQQLINEQLERS